MSDFEERLRRVLWGVTGGAPTPADRATTLHRRIARRRRIRAVGVAGAAVLVLAGASAGAVALRPSAHRLPGPAGTAAPTAPPSHAALAGAKNILLVGEDPNGTTQQGGADAILILHLTADGRSGYLIPVPRDTYARIPPYDNGAQRYPGGNDRIGLAYGYGARGLTGAPARTNGFRLLSRTVTALTGVTVDAGIDADLTGVEKVIDAIGGVDLYVDEKTTSIDVGHDASGKAAVPWTRGPGGRPLAPVPGVTPDVFNVGNQHLTGAQAVDYIRQRDLLANGDGDYGRQRHEAQLLAAVYAKVLHGGTVTDPHRLAGLLNTLDTAVTVDGGGAAATDWVSRVRDLPGLTGIATNRGQYNPHPEPNVGDVELLSDTSRELFDAVRADTVGRSFRRTPTG